MSEDKKVHSEDTRDILELVSNSSLIDFLTNEETCENVDENQLFSEINRLATLNINKYESEDEDRTIEELLKEAETLINQPICVEQEDQQQEVPNNITISCESTPLEIRNNLLDRYDYSTVMSATSQHDDDTSERTILNDQLDSVFDSQPSSSDEELSMKSKKSSKSPSTSVKKKKKTRTKSSEIDLTENDVTEKLPSEEFEDFEKILRCDKSTAPSPTHSMISIHSSASWLRERELETSCENLNESLKDAEERYNSLRIQYDSLSQIHRVLRENHLQLQEENEKLKIDLQIINECTNTLRCDLKNMKQDLDSANEISRILQQEIDENRVDRKKFQDISERDAKIILDLQRQCKEMERILMRKHPDSVSALIVASKNSNNQPEFSASTRRVLEERIAQLEKDAKEQDKKAQDLLTNVQSRFKTVQSKYENHIQDLETQVLSLQQINLEHSKELHLRSQQKSTDSISTQTIDVPEKEIIEKRSIASQTITPPSRSNSAQSVTAAKKSKIPTSNSETSIQSNKEDAHLMATIRGMRVELAIKDKAVQRLTRELDECKKTMKKLQKERDAYLAKDKSPNPTAAPVTPKKVYNPSHYQESGNDTPALKEAMSKIKLLENDFKTLYDKRVKDLKTLQSAHERELQASHETIRILQNRLEEQVSMVNNNNVKEKRRGPIDFYALKAKVQSLERRHSEREKSLHLLIDALSKGKVNSLSTDESTSPTCSSPINKNL